MAGHALPCIFLLFFPHCPFVNIRLEPQLAYIGADWRRVVCPIVDVIDDDTLEYSLNGGYQPGGFSWSGHFTWEM